MGRIGRVWSPQTEVIVPLGILSLAFVLGGLGGLLFAGTVEGEGGAALTQYLRTYFQLAGEGVVPAELPAILWGQIKFPLCCFVLGLSSMGLVGLPILFGMRGFTLVYGVSCLYRIFGESGMVCGGFLFGLPALITVPALFVMGVQGMGGGYALLRRSMGGRHSTLPYSGAYFGRCALCALAVGVAVVVEWWIIPILLQSVAVLVI